MKLKLTLMLLAVVGIVGAFASSAQAVGISINIGDRPYYNRGPFYWAGGHRWVWVQGHYGHHRHWMHGHYVRR
jgi:hypothetical protein